MTTYNIHYTDPLRTSFSIAPGSHNGPGSPTPKTTLGLYGRGAHEWGESINENFVRLVENFASATAPLSPVSGQIWVNQRLYWRNNDVALPGTGPTDVNTAPTGAFYRFNTDTGNWETGLAAPVSVINRTSGVPNFTGVLGQHVFNIFDQTLYLWESPYKQAPAMWITRELSNASTASPIGGLVIPTNGVTVPEYDVFVYDQYSGDWSRFAMIVNGNIELGPQSYPLADSDNAATIEYVNDGLASVVGTLTEAALGAILDVRYVNVSGDTMTGFLTLNADPVNTLHAATKQYVDTGDASLSVIINSKVSKIGDTMTGFLTLNADPVNTLHAATKQYVDTGDASLSSIINSKVAKAGDTMTGLLTLSADPVSAAHAATKQYVDNVVAAATGAISSYTITYGSSYAIGFSNTLGMFIDSTNYFDVFPPLGKTMGNIVAFIPSIHVIHFAGNVNYDDSMRCTYTYMPDRIRVYVQNTEQRATPAANWLAIWS